jgi:hypothetical protein
MQAAQDSVSPTRIAHQSAALGSGLHAVRSRCLGFPSGISPLFSPLSLAPSRSRLPGSLYHYVGTYSVPLWLVCGPLPAHCIPHISAIRLH